MGILQGLFTAAAVLLYAAATTASAQQASGVYATINLYNEPAIGWNLNGDSAFCSTWDENMPMSWLQEYPWTAFCGPAGPPSPDFCGKCLKVTNSNTGASTTVRIVDHCSSGGLELDQTAFNTLDTNGDGYASGHLTVDYEFVGC